MGNQLGINRPAYTRAGVTRASVNRVRIQTTQADLTPHHTPSIEGGGGEGPSSATRIEKTVVEELLEAADRLPPAARKQLLDHLALRSANTDLGDPRDVDMWAGAVYEALRRELGASGGSLGGPMTVKRAVGAASAFGFIRDFVADAGLADAAVMEKQSFYQLLARLLVSHAADVARHVGAPLSVKFVANNSVNVAAVFERSFPGYLRSGLVRIPLRALTRRA